MINNSKSIHLILTTLHFLESESVGISTQGEKLYKKVFIYFDNIIKIYIYVCQLRLTEKTRVTSKLKPK